MTIGEGASEKEEPLEKRLDRLERQSRKTLAIVQEIRVLLEPSETEKDPVKILKRYLMWLVVHVGQIEERSENLGAMIELLLAQGSMHSSTPEPSPSSGPMMEDEEDEYNPF